MTFSIMREHTYRDGRWFPVTWENGPPEQPAIRDDDIVELAGKYDIKPANLYAVLAVESSGHGFLVNEPQPKRPKILFEAHWFYKLTPQPVSKTRPDLSSRKWNRSLYKGGSAEWDRLRDACKFDFKQALKSASWGLGQVMGFNHAAAGCETVEQFVIENFTSERLQFQHMIEFCKEHDLLDDIRDGDWETFARGYNGPGYRKNQYHAKLQHAASNRFA